MRRTSLIAIIMICGGWSLSGQVSHFICGNEVFSDILHQRYPALQDAITRTFEQVTDLSDARSNEPLDVNVVIHVVWNDPAENLHDSVLLDQIRILNEDFNRMNADTVNLRALFKPEAGTPGIRFNLVDIIRIQTEKKFSISLLSGNLLAEVKRTQQGGSDARDPERYINIWVCKIQPITIFGIEVGQILGFAFPPNNLGNWPANSGAPNPDEDGVVIDFRVFGSNNPNSIQIPGGGGALAVMGRTPVHEMGHYLGLRHIWGDGGLLGPNDCAQSDGIDDTPFANAQSAFDCDTLKNTCSQHEIHYQADVPDLIENFMDYASETCMNMFTRGQAIHMRNVLFGPRSGLLSPLTHSDNFAPVADIKVFPNPAVDEVHLSLSVSAVLEASVNIIPIYGGKISAFGWKEYDAGHHVVKVDIAGLLPGIYIVELMTMHGALSKVFIKH